MSYNLITLSHPTYVGPSGATAAATYQFMSSGYEAPAEPRHLDFDVVHNQNGKFKYVYDNGPGFRRFSSFAIACEIPFEDIVQATAEQQYERLLEMWRHRGILGLEAAGEVFNVHWTADPVEPNFVIYPQTTDERIERRVTVQFEEA